MSRNAVAACARTGVPLAGFERAPWQAGGTGGDDWRAVPDLAGAVAALPDAPMRVFLAIGKQNLDVFATKPQHHYLLRLVDPPESALPPLPDAQAVIARGPFDVAGGDTALLTEHCIDLIVAKNAGGTGARAKLEAARALGIPVVMIDRPPQVPERTVLSRVDEILHWLDHSIGTERGV